jgi:endogenous inhibitor of DNA gyrase (YacG/DUF329 family)
MTPLYRPQLSQALAGASSDADVQVGCPTCGRQWRMDETYIATRAGRTNYSCPPCQTVLAFVEENPTGLTYGVPHGYSIQT